MRRLSFGRDLITAILRKSSKVKLLDVVAIGKTVVAEQIAVAPEFLNDSFGYVNRNV